MKSTVELSELRRTHGGVPTSPNGSPDTSTVLPATQTFTKGEPSVISGVTYSSHSSDGSQPVTLPGQAGGAQSSSSSSSPPSTYTGSANTGVPSPSVTSLNGKKKERRKSSALRKLVSMNPTSSEDQKTKTMQARRSSFMNKVNMDFQSWTLANPEGSHEMLRSSYPFPYPSVSARGEVERRMSEASSAPRGEEEEGADDHVDDEDYIEEPEDEEEGEGKIQSAVGGGGSLEGVGRIAGPNQGVAPEDREESGPLPGKRTSMISVRLSKSPSMESSAMATKRNRYMETRRGAGSYQRSLGSQQQTRSLEGGSALYAASAAASAAAAYKASSIPEHEEKSRWVVSLRNVIFLLNAVLVVVCVVVIASFSFNAHNVATITILNDTCNKVTESLVERLSLTISVAADLANGLATSVAFGQISTSNQEGLARYTYDSLIKDTFALHTVQLGDSNNLYVSAIKLDTIGNFVSQKNVSTDPTREVYYVNPECDQLNSTCSIFDYALGPAEFLTTEYNVTEQIWYQYLEGALGPATQWTGASVETAYREIAIFYSNAVMQNGITYVASTAVRFIGFSSLLQALSTSLEDSSSSSAGGTDFSQTYLAFVVEVNGDMVATSNYVQWEVQNLTDACNFNISCSRINAGLVDNPVIQDLSNSLVGPYPASWDSLPYVDDLYQDIRTVNNIQYVIFVNRVNFVGVNWYVVCTFDVTEFLQLYQILDSAITPVVVILLVLFALAVTYYFTNNLTKTLNSVSQQLLTIASLDFTQLYYNGPTEKRSNVREIARISDAMDSMKSALGSFSKYVPSDVVRLLQLLKREAVLGVDEALLSVSPSLLN